MTDPFVPEADRLEQDQDAAPHPVPSDDEAEPPLDYPVRIPPEAAEGDLLEQSQSLAPDDDDGR